MAVDHRLNELVNKYNDRTCSRFIREACYAELYTSLEKLAHYIGIKSGLNKEDREDLFHDAFLDALEKYSRKSDTEEIDFKTTFGIIMKRKCSALCKERKKVTLTDWYSEDCHIKEPSVSFDAEEEQKDACERNEMYYKSVLSGCDALRDAVLVLLTYPTTNSQAEKTGLEKIAKDSRLYFPCFFTNDIGELMAKDALICEYVHSQYRKYQPAVNEDFVEFYSNAPARTLMASIEHGLKPCSMFEFSEKNEGDNGSEVPCGYPLKWFVFREFATNQHFSNRKGVSVVMPNAFNGKKNYYRDQLLKPVCEKAEPILQMVLKKYNDGKHKASSKKKQSSESEEVQE